MDIYFQYAAVGNEGPAILFVHGFGAFLEHFRDNIASVAEAGNRVWAITLLGFGKSEKPNTIYSELMWAELLRDFIVDVVGEPAHLVGNSIGGTFLLRMMNRRLNQCLANKYYILEPFWLYWTARVLFSLQEKWKL